MANGYNSSSASNLITQENIEGGERKVKNIKNLKIDISDMPTAVTDRVFTVNGTIGAQFQVIVLQNPASASAQTLYYDFTNQSFSAGHNDLNNNLIITLSSGAYSNNIAFPSGGGEFVIKLMPINNTKVQGSINKIITKSISKASANTTVTFTPGTLTANAANYATLPTSTSVGAVNSTDIFSFNWAVTNSTTDAKSFGFRLVDTTLVVNDSYWYFEEDENVFDNPAGDGEDSTTVQVASLTNIGVGMELKFHKGTTVPTNKAGSAVGLTLITAIDTTTKIITFNKAVAFEDGETMKLRAYTAKNIKAAIGLDLTITTTNFEGETLTSTLRDDSDGDFTTSTTVRLGATNGVSGGDVVIYKGLGVNNVSSNRVTSVTPDPDGSDGDGAMVVELTQVLRAGTVITFKGSHKIVNFSGSVTINKYSTANQTIYLDLEKIITLGAAS